MALFNPLLSLSLECFLFYPVFFNMQSSFKCMVGNFVIKPNKDYYIALQGNFNFYWQCHIAVITIFFKLLPKIEWTISVRRPWFVVCKDTKAKLKHEESVWKKSSKLLGRALKVRGRTNYLFFGLASIFLFGTGLDFTKVRHFVNTK